MIKLLANSLGVRSDFEYLFFINEYKTLAGNRNRTILTLILILFLTFLALGFAVGGIQNLKQKMDNPFTNWVNLNINSNFQGEKARKAEEDYQSNEKRDLFNIADVRGWSQVNLQTYHQNFNPCLHRSDTLLFSSWGRILEPDDPLWSMVLSTENVTWLSNDLSITEEEGLADCELIVSEELLTRLGYAIDNEDIGTIFVEEEGTPLILNVIGVVKELPKFCEFICAPQLYNIKAGKRDGRKACNELLLKNEDGQNNFSLLADSKAEAKQIKSLATTFFSATDPPEVRITDPFMNGSNTWGICELDFLPIDSPTLDSLQLFINFARKQGILLGDILRLECEIGDYCDYVNFEDYHYLAFNFNRLYDIRNFQADIKQVHGVEVDMSQVEAKENFALVGWLTWIISLILLAFGILSIILFVNSLLSAHLYQVRPNLGTFKAFGLSDRFLNTIYLKIIFCFLLLAIGIAFLGAVAVDRVEQFIALEESKFNIFGMEILVAIFILVTISLFISSRTIQKILGDTPGNLIYGR